MIIFAINMVIFHGYVETPESNIGRGLGETDLLASDLDLDISMRAMGTQKNLV